MKPLLAAKVDPRKLSQHRYPLLASPKIDGIRCLTFEGGLPKSRKLLDIPNRHVREALSRFGVQGLDGELVVPGAANFGEVSSAIMSESGQPRFEYHVFDVWSAPGGFGARLEAMALLLASAPGFIKPVPQIKVDSAVDVHEYEASCLSAGYEGVMLRELSGPYKCGRSTLREQILLKLKRFEDAEAVVIGLVEELQNENELTRDELGHAKRSSRMENKRPKGVMGALICRRPDGLEFKIGTGFTQEQRELFWAMKDQIVGRTVTYRFQPAGAKEAPGFPAFVAFREDL